MSTNSFIQIVLKLLILGKCIKIRRLSPPIFRITMYRNDDGEGESEIYVHIDLEYIGPNDSIKILHCDPVIVGTIIDRDSISIDDEIV